jgi:hypothetical protein
MDYTKNQHVLSQWVLRNFRSDDTALSAKEKQRVWCHTVYMTPDKENVLHTQPLPISSVAVSKTAFVLLMLRQDCLSILKTNWVCTSA